MTLPFCPQQTLDPKIMPHKHHKEALTPEEQDHIEKTINFVKGKLLGEGTGHDWWHTYRVWAMAIKIAHQEQCNLFIVQLAALLHDIADWKFDPNLDDTTGPTQAMAWLEKLSIDPQVIKTIGTIIQDMSFKGAHVATPMQTIEGKIVQDADRLDAIGALGIARAFAYGGYKKQEIHNPTICHKPAQSFEEYKNGATTTINHFYEKLLLVKNRMNTKTAQQVAQKRHEVMIQYLDVFFKEWQGLE